MIGVMNLAGNEKNKTVAAVWSIAEPIAEELGLFIWDIRFLKEGATWYLRIFIDKEDGVGITDCENMSRAIDKPLDEADPIEQSYCLEVSSPGIERELIRDFHFECAMDCPIKLRLIRPDENGRREFSGVLKDFEDGILTVETKDGETINFNKKDTSWVKLDDFGGF